MAKQKQQKKGKRAKTKAVRKKKSRARKKSSTKKKSKVKKKASAKKKASRKKKKRQGKAAKSRKESTKGKGQKKKAKSKRTRKAITVRSRRAKTKGTVERIASREEIRECYEARCDELCTQRKKAEKTLTRFKKSLATGKYGEITGCTIGFRTKCGRVVLPLQYVIEVSVPTKHPKCMFKTRNKDIRLDFKCLPRSYYGIQVKVVQKRPYLLEGRLLFGDEVPIPDTTLPAGVDLCSTHLKGGLPIRNQAASEKAWGTMGICFLGDDGEFRAFTNAHIATKNDIVVQPPLTQASLCYVVGEVEDAVSLGDTSSSARAVDAAIIKLVKNGDTARDFSDGERVQEVIGFGLPVYFAVDRLPENDLINKVVFKYGARTGLRAGVVNNLKYDDLKVGGVDARRVVEVARDSGTLIDGGDSGSALLIPITTDGKNAMLVGGLFFAGVGVELAYACQFIDVLDVMNVSQLPNDRLLRNSEWQYRDHQFA